MKDYGKDIIDKLTLAGADDAFKIIHLSACYNDAMGIIQKMLEQQSPEFDGPVQSHVQMVCKALREDPSYYISWQANIAMAFKDLVQYNVMDNNNNPVAILIPRLADELANQAAKNFLNLLIKE